MPHRGEFDPTTTGAVDSGACSGGGLPELPGRWRAIRWLGGGGHGEVWLCEDGVLGELVALKILGADLTPAGKERFRREVSIGRTLRHPRLVEVYEAVELDGRLGLAMEWLPGGTLAQRLGSEPLSVDEVIRFAEEVLDGLAFLHAMGIVHRDVKPSNLLFDAGSHVKLGDLGLARPLARGITVTRELSAVGTPAYMSPEQLRNAELTPAADLYGLGVTLYEALAGRPPFDGKSEIGSVGAQLSARPGDLGSLRPDCPRWLRRFVHRLLEKRPRDRFRHAGAAAVVFRARRWTPSPRILRRFAGAAGGVLATALSLIYIVPGLTGADRTAVAVRYEGDQLQALNADGATVWRRSFSSPVHQAFMADLDGDGTRELLATAFPRTSRRAYPPVRSEVAVMDARGRVRSSVEPEILVRPWRFPTPELFMPWLQLADLDADDRPEVLVTLLHRDALPCVLLVYLPRRNAWFPLVSNEGYIHEVVVVPGSPLPRLRIRAYNNALGMVHVVAELEIDLDNLSAGDFFAGLQASPDRGGFGSGPVRWTWYTAVEPRRPTGNTSAMEIGEDGSTTVTLEGHTVRIDRFGNPDDGPNFDRDLVAERARFFGRLLELAPGVLPGRTVAHVEDVAAEIRARFPDLLRERPLSAMLAIREAEALAHAGATSRAIEVLTEAGAELGWEDLKVRRAELEAIEGRFDLASQLLDDAGRAPITPAGNFRAYRLQVALAIERNDRPEWSRRVARFAGLGVEADQEASGKAASLAARARLWWDEALPEDENAVAWGAFCPDGEVVAFLARWRRGDAREGDLAGLDRAVLISPEARLLGAVARAAVLSSLDRGDEALAQLAEVLLQMEVRGRTSFQGRQEYELARALYATVLYDTGRHAEALAAAYAIRPQLRADLLPRILVDEVIEQAGRAEGKGGRHGQTS